MAQAKKRRTPKSHKLDPQELARRRAKAIRAGTLLELRETRSCTAPLQSLTGTLGECGRAISYGEQHRYLPDGLGRDLPICMGCVYRLQGVLYPMARAPRQGFKPARFSA